jgi:hypothetical protein
MSAVGKWCFSCALTGKGHMEGTGKVIDEHGRSQQQEIDSLYDDMVKELR